MIKASNNYETQNQTKYMKRVYERDYISHSKPNQIS